MVDESAQSTRNPIGARLAFLTLAAGAALLAAGCPSAGTPAAATAPLPAAGAGEEKKAVEEEPSVETKTYPEPDPVTGKVELTESEWRAFLSPEEYHVLREKGTELACSGDLWNNKKQGTYVCAGCGQPLFRSGEKFESGTGWPSYFAPIDEKALHYEQDLSFLMVRTEVLCSRCGGHLGHVFDDGPEPTGKRFCMNSVSLDFQPAE